MSFLTRQAESQSTLPDSPGRELDIMVGMNPTQDVNLEEGEDDEEGARFNRQETNPLEDWLLSQQFVDGQGLPKIYRRSPLDKNFIRFGRDSSKNPLFDTSVCHCEYTQPQLSPINDIFFFRFQDKVYFYGWIWRRTRRE